MDLSDDFFLGWLARDARFQASVHFSPKTKLGYTIHRKVYASMEDEPHLTMWLRDKGINGRILRDKKEIALLLNLLRPVAHVVKDRGNLSRLRFTMEMPSARKMTHEDIEEFISEFDSRFY